MRPRPARLLLLVLPALALAGCYAPYDPGYPPGGEVYGVAPDPGYGPYYAPVAPYDYPPAYGFGLSYSYIDIDRHGHGKHKHHYGYKNKYGYKYKDKYGYEDPYRYGDKHPHKGKGHYRDRGHAKPHYATPKHGGRAHAAVPYKDPRGSRATAVRRQNRHAAAPDRGYRSGVTPPSQRIVPTERSAARGYSVRQHPSGGTRYNYGKPGGRGG